MSFGGPGEQGCAAIKMYPLVDQVSKVVTAIKKCPLVNQVSKVETAIKMCPLVDQVSQVVLPSKYVLRWTR